jgi:hypothetical protein
VGPCLLAVQVIWGEIFAVPKGWGPLYDGACEGAMAGYASELFVLGEDSRPPGRS